MTPTKLAMMTWPDNASRNLRAIYESRLPYIDNAVANGLTDGVHVDVSDVLTTRTWLDQTSAQEWADFIIALAASNGITVTVQISDLP